MSLIKLSSETIARILGLTDTLQIRRCRQVCRLLRDVVDKNALLQYLLELDLSGYSLPPVQRQDINYEEKVKVLRACRNGWKSKHTKLSRPFCIPFKSARIHSTCFIDGVFACGYKPDKNFKAVADDDDDDNSDDEDDNGRGDDDADNHDDDDDEMSGGDNSSQPGIVNLIAPNDTHHIRVIRFDQLPSRNRGSGHKHWECDLGYNAVHFAICPDQDLLVTLQQLMYNYDEDANEIQERYKIHLRTMSTNEIHPASPLSSGVLAEFDFAFGAIDGPAARREDFDMQIYGDLLVVRLGTGEPGLPPYFEVWNWVSGQNLARAALEEDTLQESGGSLISKNFFVVPYFAEPGYQIGGGSYAGLGGLDVYYVPLDNSAGRPEVTDRVARLSLPKLSRSQDYQTMRLYSVPVRTSTADYPQSYSKSPAKTYNPDLGNYIHLHIRVSMRGPMEGKRRTSTSVEGDLVVSAALLSGVIGKVLGNDFSPKNRVNIPWESWRHCACFLPNAALATGSAIDNSGLGVGFPSNSGRPPSNDSSLLALDFNPRRLRVRRMGKCEFEGDILPSTSKDNHGGGDIDDDRRLLEQAFADCPQTPWYTQKSLGPGASATSLDFGRADVKADVEHVVFVYGANKDPDRDLRRGLEVYEL